MRRASIFGLSWVIAVATAAIALAFAYPIDFSVPELRFAVAPLLLFLAGFSAWVKVRVDRLQESESTGEYDEDFLYYATSSLQREVWALVVLYISALLCVLVAMAVGAGDVFGLIVTWLAYVLIALSICSIIILINMDRAVGREVSARKKARHIRNERNEQRSRLESDEELPARVAEHLRNYNKTR